MNQEIEKFKAALAEQTKLLEAREFKFAETVKSLSVESDAAKKKQEEYESSIKSMQDTVEKLQDAVKSSNGALKRGTKILTVGEAVVLSKEFSTQGHAIENSHLTLKCDSGNQATIDIHTSDAVKSILGDVSEVTKSTIDLTHLYSSGVLQPQQLEDVFRQTRASTYVHTWFNQGRASLNSVRWNEYFGYSPVASLLTADVAIGATAIALEMVEGLTPAFPVILVNPTTNARESFRVVSIDSATKTVTLDNPTVTAFTISDKCMLQAGRLSKFGNNFLPGTAQGVQLGAQKPFGYMHSISHSEELIQLATLLSVHVAELEDHMSLIDKINEMATINFPDMIEDHVINGTGVKGETLKGILNYNKIQSLAQGAEIVPTSIRNAIAQVKNAGARDLKMIGNDFDFSKIDTIMDSTGRYLHVANEGKIWNVEYADSSLIEEKNLVIGDFKRAATLRKRNEVSYSRALENRDNFERNLVTYRQEQRMMLQWQRPEYLLKLSLT